MELSWRQGELSPGGAARAPELPPDTVRLSDLAQRIQAEMRRAFPRKIWVVGEVSGLNQQLGRTSWFFKLCESRGGGKPFTLDAVLWDDERRLLFGKSGRLTGVVDPCDGIQVRALVEIAFWPTGGQLRLVVRDIDPTYTLGRLALERRKVIERLQREGLLERQKALQVSELPLRVGLITAADSAAYNDFTKEIRAARFAFRVLFFDARMQGEATVPMVVRGLRVLCSHRVDVIALVRGGGASTDLAWFDHEEIARAIAACPIPVFTGIGHEIDTSVADLAANRHFKTPTAVAAELVGRAGAAARFAGEATRRLFLAATRPGRERHDVQRQAGRMERVVAAQLATERRWLHSAGSGAARAARTQLVEARRFTVGAPQRVGALADRMLDHCRLDLRGHTRRAASPLLLRPLRVLRDLLDRARLRVKPCAQACTAGERERLAALEARARLLDPAHVLRRGFALLRDAGGAVIKDAAQARDGQTIRALLRDGEFEARVERKPRRPRRSKAGSDDEQAREGRGRGGSRQLEIW